jgi:hypothetical protein
MKLRKIAKPEKAEKKPPLKEGAWTKSRDEFMKLEPIDLGSLPRNVMVCSVAHRPYLSTVAKMEGATYTTIGLGDGNMAVFKYKVGKRKGNENE